MPAGSSTTGGAIIHADPQEVEFCQAAGRLGRDPYRLDEWNPAIVGFLESGLGADAGQPLAGDFLDALETARPTYRQLGSGSSSTRDAFRLGDAPPGLRAFSADDEPPATAAYRLARELRNRLGVGPAPLADVGGAAHGLGVPPLVFNSSNHLSTRDVKGIVGWAGGKPIVAGPAAARPSGRRFLEARLLFLAISQCQGGPRLITSAHTWSQKGIPRAFAAELLAPQSEILQRWTLGDRFCLPDSIPRCRV